MQESLLKKSGKKDTKKPNRVVFNETKNEFFDADYIILIREECDYDDEDEESVCTCYQHEMVRLTCCEPNCDCNAFDDLENVTREPQSPKFAPPLEFVDAVTLSPPEGYKDMELEEREMMVYKQMARRGQRAAVCRECSASSELDGEKGEEIRTEAESSSMQKDEANNESEKIDQSQQTTPTSPNTGDDQQYLIDSIERNEQKQEENSNGLPSMGSPVSGILKGGKLWRQQGMENSALKLNELVKTDSTSDDEGSSHRMVRFIEAEGKKASYESSPETERQVEGTDSIPMNQPTIEKSGPEEVSEPTEMMLTFKLGNHVLISNNSLKPNSAVRQLFPCTKPLNSKDSKEQYLVTAESLRAFEEAKRSKLPQVIQNVGTNESIKRVIERNTLRRSLVRYEPKSKKSLHKTDNSLVERIKQLTCDIDDEANQEPDELSVRISPTGEEGNNTAEINQVNKYKDRNFSPSSSSTTSSNSSSMSSTYKKITDLFGKREKPDNLPNVIHEPRTVQTQTLPDIGGPFNHDGLEKTPSNASTKQIADSRKQFLSTLAPLTACVSNLGPPDDHYYHLSNQGSVTSSTGSEYTLDDIDEGLQNDETKKITPDVLAGTPASESGDELAVFVQQDASRIERIKKKYENDQSKRNDKEEDEQDDYGFNRRPSVRGIKPRFGSTSEILQQIQNHIQQPAANANVSWPYYSETNLNREEDPNRTNSKPNYPPPYSNIPEDAKARGYIHYRPENLYQNCSNQSCYKEIYKTHSSVIEIDCNDYQTIPKRNGRPLSPPPQEISKTYHQTMVYIPYNHIEGYQPVITSNTYQTNEFYRYNQNQINKKYIEPYYQTPPDEQYCNSNVQAAHKTAGKPAYPNNYQAHLVAPYSRSESPLGNFSMARATQTAVGCVSGCNYYQGPAQQLRYRDPVWPPQWKGPGSEYTNKTNNRHSFPTTARPRYPPPETATTDLYHDDLSSSQHNGQNMNGYYNYLPSSKESPTDSPTKARFIERGVPEGAASVSPQDSISLPNSNSSVTTSPTMSHTITNANGKPLFYAMNV